MTLRVGIIGLTHDHIWGHIQPLQDHPDVELLAAADPHAELLEKLQAVHPCQIYANYTEMLQNEQLDAVYVFADNKNAATAATAALHAGLHVMIEKPMAVSAQAAQDMYAATQQHNKRLMINWPTMWWPHLQQAIALAKDGLIGDLWQVRYRAAHSGPRGEGCSAHFCEWLYDKELNGAGAFMDYCCYGSILSQVMLGSPQAVTGISAQIDPGLPVEDNGVLMLHYPKALAVAEASWSQIGKITAYTTTFYGSTGLLLMDQHREDALIHATKENGAGVALEIPALPAHLQNATNHFVHGIQSGERFHDLVEADVNVAAQQSLSRGLESAAKQQRLDM